MSDYLDGGPWTAEDHARHPSFDAGLTRAINHLVFDWRGFVVFDVGGGPGLYLESLAKQGARCVVVEPEPMILPAEVVQLQRGLTAGRFYGREGGGADVVLCLEVLEHVARDDHPIALENLCSLVRKCGILVFSAATPGQGGQGHVAERPQGEWAGELEARGLTLDLEATARLRLAADLPWHKANVMVWRRKFEST